MANDTHTHTLQTQMGDGVSGRRDQSRAVTADRDASCMGVKDDYFVELYQVMFGYESPPEACRNPENLKTVFVCGGETECVCAMGFTKNFGKPLRRMSRFFYRFPKVMRRSGRLEVSLLWRSSGEL